jgi:hypothetical protein
MPEASAAAIRKGMARFIGSMLFRKPGTPHVSRRIPRITDTATPLSRRLRVEWKSKPLFWRKAENSR